MFKYRPFQIKDAFDIKEVALKSWLFTYGHIYDDEYIQKRINKAYEPELLQKLTEPINQGLTEMFVCEYNEKVIGFAQVGYYKYYLRETIKQMELSRIYIDPEYSRKGIGEQLLNLVEKWVIRKNFDKYCLFVHQNNPIGIKFYQKNGFKRNKAFDEEDELYYEKTLLSK